MSKRSSEADVRVPPHDIEAERAVVGSILLDSECLSIVRRSLKARDFYGADCKIAFDAICGLADSGRPIDVVTLAGELREGGQLEQIGGPGFLADLGEAVPSAANAAMYAETVARLSRRRRALRAAERLIEAGYDPTASADRMRRLARTVGRAFEGNGHVPGEGRELLWRPASEIEQRELRWCWPGRLPLGGVTVLVGPAGEGKSVLTCDMTARISAGLPWPDGSPAAPGCVAFVNAEDPADRVTIPRLVAAGAKLENVHIVEGVKAKSAGEEPERDVFDLRRDTGLLEGLAGPDLRAVVLDPASAFLPGVDDNSNSAVRSGLARLAEFAERFDVAVLVVHHFRKGKDGNALTKVAGSLAFGALARSVWGLVRDPANPDRRLLLPIKANWTAEAAGGLAFAITSDTVTGAPVCAWESEPVDIDINELLAPVPVQDPEVRDAARWLRQFLRDGPVPSTEVQREARSAGFYPKLLGRAKAAAGVESRRVGFGPEGHWDWMLPGEH